MRQLLLLTCLSVMVTPVSLTGESHLKELETLCLALLHFAVCSDGKEQDSSPWVLVTQWCQAIPSKLGK